MSIAWTKRIAAFDTETTGVDPFDARMVSAAVVLFDEGREISSRVWEIDPGVMIPQGATRIHGVHDEDRHTRQDHAAATREIADHLTDLWKAGYTLVVYNAAFDLTLLRECISRDHDEDWHPGGLVVDPMVIDRGLDKYRKGRRTLGDQCRHYGVDLRDAHDARADAVAAGQLARKVADKWPAMLDWEGPEMMLIQHQLAKENENGLRAWFVKSGRDPQEIVGGWPMRERP